MRRTVLSLLVVAALATPGCIKVKDRTVVLPDGSGKIAMRIGLSNAAIESMGNLSDQESYDMAAEQLKEMRRDWKGFVAFTRPIKSEDGGWTYVTFDAYFEDLNAVQVWREDVRTEERVLQKSFELEPVEGGGFELKYRHKTIGDLATRFATQAEESKGEKTEEERLIAEATLEMMKSVSEDLSLDFAVEMPGDITRATGFKNTTGGTAALRVTLADLIDEKKVKALAEIKELTVRCGPANWKESDIADFNAELEDAKKEWKKLLAEVEAKEKADGKETDGDPADEGGGK